MLLQQLWVCTGSTRKGAEWSLEWPPSSCHMWSSLHCHCSCAHSSDSSGTCTFNAICNHYHFVVYLEFAHPHLLRSIRSHFVLWVGTYTFNPLHTRYLDDITHNACHCSTCPPSTLWYQKYIRDTSLLLVLPIDSVVVHFV